MRRRHDRPVPAPARASSGAAWVLVGALVSTVLATYWPVREHGAIPFDDPSYVTENEQVQAGLRWSSVRWAFGTVHAHNWHPLTWLSHMLDVELFGLDIGLHHLSSVALHAGAAALLLVFLARATGALWPSAAVAALFALHPLRVESVAWLSERKDTLSAFLFTLVLVLWTRFQAESSVRRRAAWYGASLTAYGAGLLAKPMLVSLPIVLLLLDAWPLARARGVRARSGDGIEKRRLSRPRAILRTPLLEKAPFFALAALVAGGTLLAQERVTKSLESHPLDDRLVTAVTSCWVYLGKLLWPRDLAIFYPYDAERWNRGLVAALALGLVALTAIAVTQARRRGYLCTGWLWYLVTLVPVLGLVQVGLQARADRYTYLPSIGVLVAAVWGLREIGRRVLPAPRSRQLLAVAALTVVCTFLARATREQLALWRDAETLYAHAAEVTRDNDWAHYNLAQLLLRSGDDSGAWRHFVEVARIVPHHVDALRNLGALAARSDRLDEAVELYRRAASAAPDDAYAQRDLGEALLAAGDVEAAAAALERARERRAGDPVTSYLLGTVRLRQGDADAGEELLRGALELDPGHAGAHNALGVIAASRGDLASASRSFAEAVRLEPDYAEARRNLELVEAARANRKGASGSG
jgi:protein O-mannosyl-transferase